MSFFADLLGNASLAGGQMLEDDRNIREKEALMNRQAQLETERSIATEKRKLEMQEQQRQALQQRTQDQMDQAERGGQAIGEARDMGALDKARSMVPSEGQYAGKKITLGDVDSIRANMSPEDAQKYYGIKPETTQSVLGDQLTAARAGGLHDATGSLKTAYDETVKALQAQFKENMATRQEARKEGEAKEAARKTDLQHGASMARIDASDRDRSGDKKTATFDKLTTRKQAAARLISQYDRGGMEKTDPDYMAELEELRYVNSQLAKQGKPQVEPEAKPAPGAKPAPAAKPAAKGYPDGTKLTGPGGKPYIVKNGVPVPQ